MEVRTEGVSYSYDNPPKDQWATSLVERADGRYRRLKIPFTKAEYLLVMHARFALHNQDFLQAIEDGRRERRFRPRLLVPTGYGLKDRAWAIKMIRQTAVNAAEILESEEFTNASSRYAVERIKNFLSPFLPPEDTSSEPTS